MALTYSKASQLGSTAPDFSLPATNGKTVSLSQFKDQKALVVMFMCNHCPYVIAVQERINHLAKEFASQGAALVAISSNDVENYPQDSFEKMKELAKEKSFVFPYLYDETQDVAKRFDAACTPDPYVYENVNGSFILRYRGRIDDSWKDESKVTKRELAEALDAILKGQSVSTEQVPSMGCNIKWKKD